MYYAVKVSTAVQVQALNTGMQYYRLFMISSPYLTLHASINHMIAELAYGRFSRDIS